MKTHLTIILYILTCYGYSHSVVKSYIIDSLGKGIAHVNISESQTSNETTTNFKGELEIITTKDKAIDEKH